MEVWRVTAAKWESTAFSGAGSLQTPGRWHERGSAVVYASESLAQAVLEIIAHFEGVVPEKPFVGIRAEIPDSLVVRLTSAALPAGWMSDQRVTRAIGTDWIRSGRGLALAVPSILPGVRVGGTNILINPNHPEFRQITIAGADRFYLDRRLLFRPA